MSNSRPRQSRRRFLRTGSLVLLGSAARWEHAAPAAETPQAAPRLRVALVTDLHHADRPTAGKRFYRDSLAKFAEAGAEFKKLKTDFLVCLGDCIDSGKDLDAETDHVRAVAKAFEPIGERHFVVGNHCVSALTKPEFLRLVGQKESCYSFDRGGWHFIVLDACFRGDGQPYGRKNFDWRDANVPPAQIDWLQADLRKTDKKCIVLVHQPLDAKPPHGVKNAAEVRKALEESSKVRAVLQGHDHRGGYRRIGAIHYCTLTAMVEGSPPANSAYAVLDILDGGAIRITGYRRQPSYAWSQAEEK